MMNGFDKRLIARMISQAENETEGSADFLNGIWSKCGNAYRIGITGPPGAGKSSLVEKLAAAYIENGNRVGLVMVDPSSPFSGGALLGDRLRLNSISTHPNIFIRSMATRGSLGGLSKKTRECCDILDAHGADVILIETVGVGQIELDISQESDIAVVVLVPESGDEVQAMKAGLMEIGGIFVINKSDRDGANRMEINLRSMLELKNTPPGSWKVPVLKTVAVRSEGVDKLLSKLSEHREYLLKTKNWHEIRINRFEKQVRTLIQDSLLSDYWTEIRTKALSEILSEGISQSPGQIKNRLDQL